MKLISARTAPAPSGDATARQQANLGEQMHPAEIHEGEITAIVKVQVKVAVVRPDAKRDASAVEQRPSPHERQQKQQFEQPQVQVHCLSPSGH